MHAPGVVVPPALKVTQWWWGTDATGLPIAVNEALDKIESEHMDLKNIYRVPGSKSECSERVWCWW